MNKKMTKRQKQVYDYIVSHIQNELRPPTIREIGREVGIASTNGVSDHLKALKKKGYLYEGKHLKPTSVVIETEKIVPIEKIVTIEKIVEKTVMSEKPTILVSTYVDVNISSLNKAQKMCVLLSELQNSYRIYKNELKKRYEIDDRTLRRYLTDLSEMGINITKGKCSETKNAYFQIMDKL